MKSVALAALLIAAFALPFWAADEGLPPSELLKPPTDPGPRLTATTRAGGIVRFRKSIRECESIDDRLGAALKQAN